MNPSGSGKDRFVYPLLLLAKKLGIEKVVEVSSGNTGISLAYYGKMLGIKTKVYIKKKSSGIKKMLIGLMANEVEEIDRDDINILEKDVKEGYYPCFSVCELHKSFESLPIYRERAIASD